MVSFFTHIFAPYFVATTSLGGFERELVYTSWQTAAAKAREAGIEVEFLACFLGDDADAAPDWARKASPLTHYALSSSGHRLPAVGQIWDRGVSEGTGKYLVCE